MSSYTHTLTKLGTVYYYRISKAGKKTRVKQADVPQQYLIKKSPAPKKKAATKKHPAAKKKSVKSRSIIFYFGDAKGMTQSISYDRQVYNVTPKLLGLLKESDGANVIGHKGPYTSFFSASTGGDIVIFDEAAYDESHDVEPIFRYHLHEGGDVEVHYDKNGVVDGMKILEY